MHNVRLKSPIWTKVNVNVFIHLAAQDRQAANFSVRRATAANSISTVDSISARTVSYQKFSLFKEK